MGGNSTIEATMSFLYFVFTSHCPMWRQFPSLNYINNRIFGRMRDEAERWKKTESFFLCTFVAQNIDEWKLINYNMIRCLLFTMYEVENFSCVSLLFLFPSFFFLTQFRRPFSTFVPCLIAVSTQETSAIMGKKEQKHGKNDVIFAYSNK